MPFARRELDFRFFSYCKEYDRSASFPFDYEPCGIPFGGPIIVKYMQTSPPFPSKRAVFIFVVQTVAQLSETNENSAQLHFSTPQLCQIINSYLFIIICYGIQGHGNFFLGLVNPSKKKPEEARLQCFACIEK